MSDVQIPTRGSSAPAIRRMFALALASNQTKMGYYSNVNSCCVAVSLTADETLARAEKYIKFIEAVSEDR